MATRVAWNWLKALNTASPPIAAALSAHLLDVGQHLAPCVCAGSAFKSACERMRQKWSMPSSMGWVMKGRMGATTAPARSNSRAACSTAARISGSTASPQPASSSKPMRSPLSFSTPWSNWLQAMSWNGRLMLSRASGRDSTCMNQAESATLRVIGPAARPM